MSEDKKIKIEFAPGCFDNFDGTQEELDEFLAEIARMVESGEFFEDAISIEDLDEIKIDNIIVEHTENRKLH